MTKVLFVEKRYSHDGAKPSVSVEWIELPEGEEEAFITKYISNVKNEDFSNGENDINAHLVKQQLLLSPVKETSSKSKGKLLPDDIATILGIIFIPIGFSIAFFVNHLVKHGN
jgi:hypothetical protein